MEVKTFFFFSDHHDFGKKNREIRDEMEVKTFCFFLKITMILGKKREKFEKKWK